MHGNRVPPRRSNRDVNGGRGGGASPHYTVEHDFSGSAELTTTVAHAVSDVTGANLTEAGIEINEHVDPNALDRLFGPKQEGESRTNASLSFDIWGNQVTIYANGVVVVAPPAAWRAGPIQPNPPRPNNRP